MPMNMGMELEGRYITYRAIVVRGDGLVGGDGDIYHFRFCTTIVSETCIITKFIAFIGV